MRVSGWVLSLFVAYEVLSAANILRAETKVEPQDVGPAAADVKYVLSPRGAHLATVGHKGSRTVVLIDGVAGPKFDAILTPRTPYVDPRPFMGPGGAGLPEQVVFSNDGNHHAYVGQSGSTMSVVVDGKELLQIPPDSAGNLRAFQMQFVGDDGKRFMIAAQGPSGLELWVDGQKWPAYYMTGQNPMDNSFLEPMIAPGSEHILGIATTDGTNKSLVLDGKETGYFGESPQFTPDGKHLFSIGAAGTDKALLLDGKQLLKAHGIYGVYMSKTPGLMVIAMAHQNKDGSAGQFLWINGKPAEQSLCQRVNRVVFSADGKRYAAACELTSGTQQQFVVVDGKKGQMYQQVVPDSLEFSADSKKLGYVAYTQGKQFVVLDDDESDPFDSGAAFKFSDDGKRVACTGAHTSGTLSVPVTVDGKSEKLDPQLNFASFAFSPDGSRYAYFAGDLASGGALYVDGKATGLSGRFKFSPDSKHIAVAGMRTSDNQAGLFLNGHRVGALQKIYHWGFTPDSQHLCWEAFEPSKNPGASPASYVTFVDGKEVARCDMGQQFGFVDPPARGVRAGKDGLQHVDDRPAPGWQIEPDGSLVALGPVGDTIKRFKITIGSDTNLATMPSADAASGAR